LVVSLHFFAVFSRPTFKFAVTLKMPSGLVVTNLVCNAKLNCAPTLLEVAEQVSNFKFDPKRFNAGIWKMPEGTVLLFPKGVVTILGTKTHESALCIAQTCADMLKQLGYEAYVTEFTVRNLVATFTSALSR
jgi:TATA-box binding protein (TBP) (component of TFIID and TFIIIB)